MESSLTVSYKTMRAVTMRPATAHLGVYPRKVKTYIYTETCAQRFIVTLCVIAKNGNQPQTGEWLKNDGSSICISQGSPMKLNQERDLV